MPRVPRTLPGCDIRSLPLSPAEAFLFSRIDGTLSENELSQITGLSTDAVTAAVDRLAQLRAVVVDGGSGGATSSNGGHAPRSAPQTPPQASRATPPPRPAARPIAPSAPRSVRYTQAELDEVVEIEPERKRSILELYYRLDDMTYYEVLGVGPDDDKKKVKSAYYAIAPEYHPDRFFRKQLGGYKAKIEAIFARVTLAHDVLSSRQRREEYDAYLEQTNRNRSMSAVLDRTPDDIAKVTSTLDTFPGSDPVPSAPPRSAEAAPRSVDPGPARTLDPAEVARARREALARKLGGGRAPSASSPNQPAVPTARPDSGTAQRAADALRARYESAIAENKREQIRRYVTNGKAALEKQDFAAAANAYRIAASLAPEDEKLAAEAEDVSRQAGTALADGYWKQAQYEEGEGRFAEAALSYAKVCNGRPNDAKAHERVAYATLKSSTNVRRAVEFARKAVELEPRHPELRLTLARAYAAAGFEKSARGELDRALELAPGDAKIADLVVKTREEAQKLGKMG
ncbi:MAG: DnaJ domain-containing protein [Byssovorax sp.]